MGQVWYKNNKAAQKYSADDIIVILEDTLNWIEIDDTIIYIGEVELYMLKTHGIPHTTRKDWIINIHNKNISIVSLWAGILQTIENRVVKDTEILRPAIQGMVLQNKHNYRERTDNKHSGELDVSPKIDTKGMKPEEIAQLINDKIQNDQADGK